MKNLFARKHTETVENTQDRYNITLPELLNLRIDAGKLLLPSAARKLQQQSGGYRSAFRGRGMEFAEVRLYQPGDDVRTIDWRVTARRQKPHTKLFHEERERPVVILCDQSESLFFGSHSHFKSVKAAQAAALVAWATLQKGDRCGGIVYSEQGHSEIKPARQRKSVMQFLSAVARYNNALCNPTGTPSASPSFSLDNALQEIRRIAKPGSLIYLISDFSGFTTITQRNLFLLAQHSDVAGICVFDPLERTLPPPGHYAFEYNHETFWLNSQDTSQKQRFDDFIQQQSLFLRQSFNQIRAPFVEVSTHEALQNTLAQLSHLLSR
ncbi:MAG: DUF58 domain-containing protein [Hahellaceae bacterium]|nr:DUF58 domain-containing protein [Hahellaceae bacterium]